MGADDGQVATTFRSLDTLQAWIAEFADLHYATPSEIRVIEQDGAQGANTGLVRVALANATTSAYIEPISLGSPEWVVTMEARDEAITLTPSDLMNLATELTTLSALCAYLQSRSMAALNDPPA